MEGADRGRSHHDPEDLDLEPDHQEEPDYRDRRSKPVDGLFFRKQGVRAEPDGQVQNDSDHGGGYRGEGGADAAVAPQPFDVWCSQKNPDEAGDEGDPVVMAAPIVPPANGERGPGFCQPPTKPTNCRTITSGPGWFRPVRFRPSSAPSATIRRFPPPVARHMATRHTPPQRSPWRPC